MRKYGRSERMKNVGLLGIYRTGSWIQIGSIYEPGQKLTLIKKMNKILQNPSKSCDFERISRFCAILIGLCLFLEFCYGFESLKLLKVAKTWILRLILGPKSEF